MPENKIKQGDPYQWQVENTVNELVKKLSIKNLNYILSYQSRVGPLKWIGPSTDIVIKEEAQKHKIIVVVPVAFVSEHSETLVELDIINSLKTSILTASSGDEFTSSVTCPEKFKKCPRIQNIL